MIDWSIFQLTFGTLLRKLIVCFLIFLGCTYIAKFINRQIRIHSTHHNEYETVSDTASIVYDTVFYSFLGIGFVICCYIFGINLTRLLGGFAFAVAYASQKAIYNILSGVLILYMKDVFLGDIIEILHGQGKSFFGRIDKITIRYSVIRKFDQKRAIIPNFYLTSFPIVTYSAEDLVRAETHFSVPFQYEPKKCEEVTLSAVNALGFVQSKENTLVHIEKLGVEGIKFAVFFYFDPDAGMLRYRAISEVDKAIKDALEKANIPFYYPHVTLTLDAPSNSDTETYTYIGQALGI